MKGNLKKSWRITEKIRKTEKFRKVVKTWKFREKIRKSRETWEYIRENMEKYGEFWENSKEISGKDRKVEEIWESWKITEESRRTSGNFVERWGKLEKFSKKMEKGWKTRKTLESLKILSLFVVVVTVCNLYNVWELDKWFFVNKQPQVVFYASIPSLNLFWIHYWTRFDEIGLSLWPKHPYTTVESFEMSGKGREPRLS